MTAEHKGEWRQVSRCRECGWTVGKEVEWMDGFFVRVCPNCGTYNDTGGPLGGQGLFEGLVARQVTTGLFRKFLRWEFRDQQEDDGA